LSSSLALLAVGLPVWLRYWPGLQVEAAQVTEAGDHARRSVIRKSYLYLALFTLVVGLMASAGKLLYDLFSNVIILQLGDSLFDLLHDFKSMSIVIIWLIYHFLALNADGKAAQLSLADQHTAFRVALINDKQTDVYFEVLENLKRTAPKIPTAILTLEAAQVADLTAYEALVFPSSLITDKHEKFQSRLQEYIPGSV